MTTTVVPTPDTAEVSLDATEAALLFRLEETIERGLKTFVAVGQALMEIRDQRLYRETHDTFEAYCGDRWQMGRSYANKLIAAGQVVTALEPLGTTVPTSERQARELTAPTRRTRQAT